MNQAEMVHNIVVLVGVAWLAVVGLVILFFIGANRASR